MQFSKSAIKFFKWTNDRFKNIKQQKFFLKIVAINKNILKTSVYFQYYFFTKFTSHNKNEDEWYVFQCVIKILMEADQNQIYDDE